mmetsp:Transcript_36063/g.84764  ORF Transcript_36063/g.84764 Transcript_36063/m.84764 type:complete len:828 (+) Transcript_36063:113-2596(+)
MNSTGLGSFTIAVHTTVSPLPLLADCEPHVVRKGAELSVTVSLNGGLAVPAMLEIVSELVTEHGLEVVRNGEDGTAPLTGVTRYVLRPGQTSASLRPRINVLSSAFDGSDQPFRIRVRCLNSNTIDQIFTPLIVVRSKWPAKSKREQLAQSTATAALSAHALAAGNAGSVVASPQDAGHRAIAVVSAMLADAPADVTATQGSAIDMRSVGDSLRDAQARAIRAMAGSPFSAAESGAGSRAGSPYVTQPAGSGAGSRAGSGAVSPYGAQPGGSHSSALTTSPVQLPSFDDAQMNDVQLRASFQSLLANGGAPNAPNSAEFRKEVCYPLNKPIVRNDEKVAVAHSAGLQQEVEKDGQDFLLDQADVEQMLLMVGGISDDEIAAALGEGELVAAAQLNNPSPTSLPTNPTILTTSPTSLPTIIPTSNLSQPATGGGGGGGGSVGHGGGISVAGGSGSGTKFAIMPSRQRTRTIVQGHEGAAAAVSSLDVALEDCRRKRRPLLREPLPQPSAGIGSPPRLLPAWLDRVSLCRSSGFIAVELVLATLTPSAHELGALEQFGQGMRVRWASANMNSALGLSLDRMMQNQSFVQLFANSADHQRRIATSLGEIATATSRDALDLGVMVLSVATADGRQFNATCHAMAHTDGQPCDSVSVPRCLVLIRVHSHAYASSPMLTLEHSTCDDAPDDNGSVVRRLFVGRVHYSSPGTFDLCGFDSWQFLGREAGCSVHPDDAQRWFAYKLEVARRLQTNPGSWVEHLFTHRHIHSTLGWMWVHCATQSRLAVRAPPPASIHDTLACALHEVIVRVTPVDAATSVALTVPTVMPPPDERN